MSRAVRETKKGGTEGARFWLRHAGRELRLRVGDFVIGRAADCQLVLSGGLVSRHHARLRQVADGLLIEDLGSRNGTVVNTRKVTEATLLAHGDIIGVGRETFEVVDDNVLSHPQHLSTMPPPPSAIARGESDADSPESVTVVADLGVLTEREREVLELIVLGHTQREMGERLCLSVKTIETHRAHIAEKLGCKTRAELVTFAISAGMLTWALRGKPSPR